MLDWLAQLLGLPRGWHGHIEDTASTVDARRARRGAHAPAGRRRLRVRAGELQRREGRAARRARVPQGRRSTTSSGCAPTSRSTTRPRSSRRSGRRRRRRSTRCRSSRDRCERGGRLAARRRRVRGLGGGLPRAPLVPRRLRPRRLDRRQPAQVAVHADGLLGALDAAARGAARGVRARARLPRGDRRTRSTCKDYGPALGRRFRALKLWFVLRWYGARGAARADPRARPAGAALRVAGCAAEPGWEVVAPHPFSTVCFRHVEADNDELARARHRDRRGCSSRRRSLRGRDVIRLAIGNAATTEADVRRAWEAGGARHDRGGDLRPLGHARRLGPRSASEHAAARVARARRPRARRVRPALGRGDNRASQTAPSATRCAGVGVPDEHVEDVVRAAARATRRRCLVPRAGRRRDAARAARARRPASG